MASAPGSQPLDPNTITLWRAQRAIRLVVFGAPMSVGAGFLFATVVPVEVAALSVAMLVLFQAVMAVFWPMLEYDAFRYQVREQDLLVQSGVIFKRWSSIPNNRIQHVDTRQGPVERILGLSRLLVFTAAGMSADGSIPGLASVEADRLRDLLSRRGGDDGV
jgi:membrane protein YdbS with pleckstrin-like domain